MPYREAHSFRPIEDEDACRRCRYALDPQVYDDVLCARDDVFPHCKGPYFEPEPMMKKRNHFTIGWTLFCAIFVIICLIGRCYAG